MGEADPEMIIVTIMKLTYRVELVNANCLKQSRRIVDAVSGYYYLEFSPYYVLRALST